MINYLYIFIYNIYIYTYIHIYSLLYMKKVTASKGC